MEYHSSSHSFEEHGKIRAASHAKLSYPHTLVENKTILKHI